VSGDVEISFDKVRADGNMASKLARYGIWRAAVADKAVTKAQMDVKNAESVLSAAYAKS